MVSQKQHKPTKKNTGPKANAWALLPVAVFLFIYISSAIVIELVPNLKSYFGTAPIAPAFVVALIVALQQNRTVKFQDKLSIVGRGIGNSSIIYMIIIFILAGLFAGTVGRSSASSVAYWVLDFVPSEFCVLVIFVVSCLVSLAMGTSVGSITLMMPIAINIALASDQNAVFCVACAICGSMFGDNLSMISDTAIAACSGLGCKPKEKFVENTKIVVPAAVLTILIILVLSISNGNGIKLSQDYNLIDFIPYIVVLVLSLCGINVMVVLGSGIICGIAIMLAVNGLGVFDLLDNMSVGVSGMYEIIFITILVASISELIKENGGFTFILEKIRKHCHSKKSAQLITGIMVGFIDVITANNTVAIVVATPIAKEICKIYEIRRRRMASVTDTFSCIIQGILPYGAQMMIAVSFVNEAGLGFGAIDIIPFCIYQYILLVFVVLFIITGFLDKVPSWIKKENSLK